MRSSRTVILPHGQNPCGPHGGGNRAPWRPEKHSLSRFGCLLVQLLAASVSQLMVSHRAWIIICGASPAERACEA